MIKTTDSLADIKQALAADFIEDKQPLRDYAGFEVGSLHAGQARQTFSLVLSAQTISNIRDQIAVLYEQLISECWPKHAPLPFDVVRFDAFLGADDEIKIIELNTRNVGLHEIAEWLDEVVGQCLSATTDFSINQHFVANQKLLHSTLFGNAAPLLYMTNPLIPKWKYFAELEKAYSSVCHVTAASDYVVTPHGLQVGETTYRAVSRKFSWGLSGDAEELDQSGKIRVLQPSWMRKFGHKNYLPQFKSPTILASQQFEAGRLDEYCANKDELVLKIINSGGSKSVYLGASVSSDEWREHLEHAAQKPELWVMQEYFAPPQHDIIVHGGKTQNVPVQLGIFVLPKQHSHEFEIDFVVKAFGGEDAYFTFDPSGLNPDIWFGHVIAQTTH